MKFIKKWHSRFYCWLYDHTWHDEGLGRYICCLCKKVW